jgi:prepilin-type N-terminal cleavage/methylation domain-containing protein
MISTCKKFEKRNKGFTLVEVIAATGILALIASSVWVVLDRCVNATANTMLQTEALDIARENLETILSKVSVEEATEFGTSERYPAIQWENVIETFYEPISSQMWIRAICTASYNNSKGQEQSVKLVHWLTGLTKNQLLKILTQEGESKEDLTSQLIETVEDAAIYAGVSPDTIQQWLDNGMLTTEDGSFIKSNLDLFKLNNGNPGDEDKKNLQIESEDDLQRLKAQQTQDEQKDEIDPKTGLTYGEIGEMDIQQIWDILKQRQQSGSLQK